MIRLGIVRALAALCGVVWAYSWSVWPPATALIAAFALAVRLRLHAMTWMLGASLWVVAQGLPLHSVSQAGIEGLNVQVEGRIAALPVEFGRKTRLILDVSQLRHKNKPIRLRGKLRLNWYGAPTLALGQQWRMTVRLRPPRNRRTDGAFNLEAYSLGQGIIALGYVRDTPVPELLASPPSVSLDAWRQTLAQQLHAIAPAEIGALLAALAVGDRSGLGASTREVLRETGTAHLLAISGLHIGLAGALGAGGVAGLWYLWPTLALWWPLRPAMVCGALLPATFYAALAGGSIATLRAWCVLGVIALGVGLRRPFDPWHSWALALLCCLVLWPASVLTAGFWLSFLAVAILLFLAHQGERVGLIGWMRLQWGLSILLLPLTLWWFQHWIPLAWPANLIAIPWFSLTTVPALLLALGAGFWPDGQQVLLGLAAGSLAAGLNWLYWLAPLAPSWPLPRPPLWWLLGLSALLLWGLMRTRRWPVVVLAAGAMILVEPDRGILEEGAVRVNVLDVGEGLAVVVHTRQHVLVYDVGPRHSTLPDWLRHHGVRTLDVLMLSHLDRQHVGATPEVMHQVVVQHVQVPDVQALPVVGAGLCQGQWRWDAVTFTVLAPTVGHGADDARSCVLRIQTQAGHSMLLAGDLDAKRLQQWPPSTVLVAPHQGRRPAPPPHVLVGTEVVVLATGHPGRHAYPRPGTVAGYAARGAQVVDTARHGTVVIDLDRRGVTLHPALSRRYWQSPLASDYHAH